MLHNFKPLETGTLEETYPGSGHYKAENPSFEDKEEDKVPPNLDNMGNCRFKLKDATRY